MGNTKRSLIKAGVFAFGFLSFISASNAVDTTCEPLPDCTTLGYEKDADCPQGTAINCPYDASYKKCVNAGCEELGYTLTNKTAWCKEIMYCPTDSAYTLCAQKCSECENGTTKPDCAYGVTTSGLDDCGHQCYTCKDCDLDVQSGYTTAETMCDFSSYVQKVISPSCPENLSNGNRYICHACPLGTIAPAKNSPLCQCNPAAGYHDACPTGADCQPVSTEFGICYHPRKCEGPSCEGGDKDGDGCNESEGWVSSDYTDAHFLFGETSTFSVDGETITCKKVIGCNSNMAASTENILDINTMYFETNENGSGRTLGNKTCHWITTCHAPYASACSEARIVSPSNRADQGGLTCGECICDESNNCYAQEPIGRSYTVVDGCYQTDGTCTEPYTADITDAHFDYGTVSDCTEVLGCKGTVQGATETDNFDHTYFDIQHVENGGKTCYYVNGCASPKVLESSCAAGEKFTNKKSAGGSTCGTCECDETQGYYTSCPTGASCDHVGSCYKTKKGGTDDPDSDGCKNTEGYVLSSVTDSHFTFASQTVSFKVGTSNVTCKKVTGCNSGVDAATESLSSINTTYFTTNNNGNGQTLGNKTCHWATGCNSPYVTSATCTTGTKLSGIQTAYTGLNCGTCECDNSQGYYTPGSEPTGQQTETVGNCVHVTGGCTAPYTSSTTDTHFSYGATSGSCREVSGCNISNQGSKAPTTPGVSPYDTTHFAVSNNTNGGQQCYWVTGCASGYATACETGQVLTDTQPSYTNGPVCGKCECDNSQGYYKPGTEPAGEQTETVGNCVHVTGDCNAPYTNTTTDTHFSYGATSGNCTEVSGCNISNQGSKAPTTPGVSPYNTAYFSVLNGTNGGQQCYWVTGCASGYTTANLCGEGQVLTDTHDSYTGGPVCGKCECDNSQGYYTSCPTGASCDHVGSCYKTKKGGSDDPDSDGCKNTEGYVLSTVTNSHFTYGSATIPFKVGDSTISCKLVTGCDSNVDAATENLSSINATYFAINNNGNGQTLGNKTCYWATGCKSPYTTSSSCDGGQTLADSQTAYEGLTCGTCVCDSSRGYYTDGSCPEPLYCVETGSNTVCKGATLQGCFNGYVNSTSNTRFTYGSAVTETTMLGDVTCYKVTGCNALQGYQEGACASGQDATDEDTLGAYTCHKCGDCVAPAGSAPANGCPTGYKTTSTKTGECGGTSYYACECDNAQGYYTATQKQGISGINFTDATSTGFSVCYKYDSCASGWYENGGYPFVYSDSTTIVKDLSGSSFTCYLVDDCDTSNNYFHRECNDSEQEFSTVYTWNNALNESFYCKHCATIPSCELPTICAYATPMLGGYLGLNLNDTAFKNALTAYKNCMSGFTMTASCEDMGLQKKTTTLFVVAPNGEECKKVSPSVSGCPNFTCESLGGQTTQPGEGWNYEQTTVNSQPCYYNITAKTCTEQAGATYPNASAQSCVSGRVSATSLSQYYIGNTSQFCYGDCKCDETHGYYTGVAASGLAPHYHSPSSCYYATCDVASSWVDNNATSGIYYDDAVEYIEIGTTSLKHCYHVDGCKPNYASSDRNTTYFAYTDETRASTTCYVETGCNTDSIDITSVSDLTNYNYATSAQTGRICGQCPENHCVQYGLCEAEYICTEQYKYPEVEHQIPRGEDGRCTTKRRDANSSACIWEAPRWSNPPTCEEGYHWDEASMTCASGYLCDETQGQYDTCPTGAYCPASAMVHGCYVPTGCDNINDNYHNVSNPFDYDTYVTFKKSGGNTQTCYHVTGCSADHVAESDWTNNYENYWYYEDDYSTKDYKCFRVDGCKKSSGCGAFQVLTNNHPLDGNDCGDCVTSCDNTQGYYDTCPTGANCPAGSMVNGCYVPTGCASGYLRSDDGEAPYITYDSTAQAFNRRSGNSVYSTTCRHVTGCTGAVEKDEFYGDDLDQYFEPDYVGQYCVIIDGCADGYVDRDSCDYTFTAYAEARDSSGNLIENYNGDPWICGTCTAPNCSQYQTTPWIESYSGTYNNATNIARCKVLTNTLGNIHLYPSTETASCGGKTYRKCVVPTCAQAMGGATNYVSYPGNTAQYSSFYRKITNASGYGITCYDTNDTMEWTSMSILNPATCELFSNLDNYTVQAFDAFSSDFIYGYACQAIDESTSYSKAVLASGFYFKTRVGAYNSSGLTEVFSEAICTKTVSGKTYETIIDTPSYNSQLAEIALILSTNEDSNDFTFQPEPEHVYECCNGRGYDLNDITERSGYYYVSGDKIVHSSGRYISGCGSYSLY